MTRSGRETAATGQPIRDQNGLGVERVERL